MPPIPRIPSGPLPPGQATLNLRGILQPLQRRPRPGPPTKETPCSQRVIGRKYIGGINEQEIVQQLARWRIQNNIKGLGEPGDQELAFREVGDIEEGIDGDNELREDDIDDL